VTTTTSSDAAVPCWWGPALFLMYQRNGREYTLRAFQCCDVRRRNCGDQPFAYFRRKVSGRNSRWQPIGGHLAAIAYSEVARPKGFELSGFTSIVRGGVPLGGQSRYPQIGRMFSGLLSKADPAAGRSLIFASKAAARPHP